MISHTRYLVGGATEDGGAYYVQTQRGEFPLPEVFTMRLHGWRDFRISPPITHTRKKRTLPPAPRAQARPAGDRT